MNVNAVQSNPAAQTAAAGAKSTTETNSLADTEAMFMTLLTTELKQQDPTSPLDPNQMVSQLTQFNVLNQVTQINHYVQSISSQGTSAAQTSGGN